MARGDVAQKQAASVAFTLGLQTTPLATSSTFLAGRQSTAISIVALNSGILRRLIVGGKVTVGTTPTINTLIQLWVYGAVNDTPLYPDTITGVDGDVTLTSAGIRDGALRLLDAVLVDATTSNRTYWFRPIDLIAKFGGSLPTHLGLWLTHNTGVALHGTGSNHAFYYTPIYDNVAPS